MDKDGGRLLMSNLILKEPTSEYADDIWKFRQEILESDDIEWDKFAGCRALRSCESPNEWIESIRLGSSADTCPSNIVPSNVYIAVRESDNRIIGITDLRHHINHPILGTWGGHIGYSVRPSERHKGYAKEMLRLNLLNAKKIGIDRILITCDLGNDGSEKTILANGGVFEKEIPIDGHIMKRYWIAL